MEISSSSGKSSSSKNGPWLLLESGEKAWNDLDAAVREEIVRHYAPKIKIIALRLKTKLPRSVELGELLSAGSLGLIEALKKYNPTLGIKFDTYSEARIKGAMLDELRRLDWFSRGLRHRIRLLEEAGRKIENTTGKPATASQLEKATGLSGKDVAMGLEALQNQLCLSLDAIQENLASAKAQTSENEPFQNAAFKEIIDKIAGLIDELTPRERLVLSLYYQDELNMREAAQVMGITEGRVSQLHAQALAKLKSMFAARYGDATI